MHFLWNVSIAVKNERGGVSVGAHVLENEPVTDLGALEHRLVLLADLVEAVASGAENSGRHLRV